MWSIYETSTKNRPIYERWKLSHTAKNKLDVACFQHDSAYNKYKNSVNKRQSDIVLKSKAMVCILKLIDIKED